MGDAHATSAVRTVQFAGAEVCRIGLGTNRLAHTSEHIDFIRGAVDAGIQLIDTAHLYAGGESEKTIGAALSLSEAEGPRVVVATKGGWGGAGRGRPEVLRAEIEESFRRLQTDTIGLWYLHRVDPETRLEDSLGAVAEYRDAGRIRHVGLSEVSVEQIEQARQVLPIAAVQNEYSLAERKHEAVLDHCEREGIPFVPFYPLRGTDGQALHAIAARHSVTERQAALAWLLARSPVMVPIPGTLDLDHVRENVAALDIELADDELEALR